MTFFRSLSVLLIILTLAKPSYAAYPIADVVDFPIDLLKQVEEVAALYNEVEKLNSYRDQLRHYYFQARKLKRSFEDVQNLRMRGIEQILRNDMVQTFLGASHDDPDFREWLELADGLSDLERSMGRFQNTFDDTFQGLQRVQEWDMGTFRLDDNYRFLSEKMESQAEVERAAVLYGFAQIGQQKYLHANEGHRFQRPMSEWLAYQNDDNDDRGRQMGADLMNASLYQLRELQLQRLKALEAVLLLEGAASSRDAFRKDLEIRKGLEALEALEAVRGRMPQIQDDVLR